jgi:hypothetical protein
MEQRTDKEVRVDDRPTKRQGLLRMEKWRMWHRSTLVI